MRKLALIKTTGAQLCSGVYDNGKFAEIWKNGNNTFFWVVSGGVNSPPKKLLGWKSFIEAEMIFSKEIYNLQLKERKF